MRDYRALFGPLGVLTLFVIGVLWSPFEPHRAPVGVGQEVGPFALVETETPEQRRGTRWADRDWVIFREKVTWALAQRLDTLPLSTAMTEMGRSFVGTAYVPRTLEVEGSEHVVVNFRGLDCVTFVENVFALSRLISSGEVTTEMLDDRAAAEGRYESALADIRYRDGNIDGYASRLHYFSDWIADNGRRGLLEDISSDLGGVLDGEPIDFMTTHPDAYRQLADPAVVLRIREAEARLNETGRYFIPAVSIAGVAGRVRDGDIIAATSTVEGLDVAHTGLALWVDGALHLLHAPLVDGQVEISEVPLAARIQRISSQDGIIVARPINLRSGGS